MFRLNRSRFLGILCIAVFIYFLAFTDSGSSSSNFRAKTEAGLAHKKDRERDLPLRGHLSDEDLTRKTNDELQGILNSQSQERLAKDEHGSLGRQYREPVRDAPARADLEAQGWTREHPMLETKSRDAFKPKVSPKVVDVTGDRGTIQEEKKKEVPSTDHNRKEKPIKVAEDAADDNGVKKSTKKDPVQARLDEYLKTPVVIFSKSYCPHSRRAKHLLLDIYHIEPKPLVVELDQLGEHVQDPLYHSAPDSDHEGRSVVTLGKALQNLLAEKTGRKTVPNIVIGGAQSIGGNDNIWSLHESGMLIPEIQKFGGRKILKVDINESEVEEKR